MSLTAAEVAEIVKLVEQSSFDELTLEIDGLKLSLRRNGAGSFAAASPALVPVLDPNIVTDEQNTVTASPNTVTATTNIVTPTPNIVTADPATHEVRSPLLGTFYRAPKPGAAPFVEVGTVVEEDTVVAIIEVMKLMNTVRAGVRGTVTEVLVSDGVLVEFDQSLMRVRKSG
ncbi:MAG TPA: acetyl-CoA carboxylase biotin carboxyl carrier protein [Steroidobacteraceae bacterium]|nr:acetyl-CoA carboxylase biotin carboxyl carrier protein [Steroidobacteraceae bacterium]